MVMEEREYQAIRWGPCSRNSESEFSVYQLLPRTLPRAELIHLLRRGVSNCRRTFFNYGRRQV
jgi:hypothetical protein